MPLARTDWNVARIRYAKRPVDGQLVFGTRADAAVRERVE
jgi:hypothetical protein